MIRIQYLKSTKVNMTAGYRLRAKSISEILRLTRNYSVQFSNKLFSGSHILIISKNYGLRFIIITIFHKIFGRKVLFDLCDIICDHNNKTPLRLILICKIADAVTVSSDGIKKRLAANVDQTKIDVIDDIAETIDLTKIVIKENQKINSKVVLYFGNELNTGKNTFHILSEYVGFMPDDASLAICSNNRPEYEKYFAANAKVQYFEWDSDVFKKLISRADIIILPFADDERGMSRSSNRLTLALAARKLVLATPIPSYCKYSHCYITLTPVNFWEVLNKNHSDIKRLSFDLSSNFNAEIHNIDVAECWERVIKKLVAKPD